jgi:hypothetical protein
MFPYLTPILCSMDYHGEYPFECGFTFLNQWIFIVENPNISFYPDAPIHNVDEAIHCKWYFQLHFWCALLLFVEAKLVLVLQFEANDF